MRLLLQLSICVIVAISIPARVPAAETPAAETDDKEAIRELVARYAAARESRNAREIEALFVAEADQLVSSGVWRKGRDELVKGMLRSSQRNPGGRTLTVESVRFVAPGVALADARYVIAGSAGREPRRMWSTFLSVRTADGWRLTAIRNMLPAR